MPIIDKAPIPTETVLFPAEQQAVAQLYKGARADTFRFDDALKWGLEQQLVAPGSVKIAEVSPTLRCPEACSLCPDSSILLQQKIETFKISLEQEGLPEEEIRARVKELRDEERATPEQMMDRIGELSDMGVRHFMFIGGTIDHLPELPTLVDRTLSMTPDTRVSWFTDMITQIDQPTAGPSLAMKSHLTKGWLKKVATHVSLDYPFQGDLFADVPNLPQKQGRSLKFKQDGEYSRRFKSEYGAVGARRLIEAGVRRVVLNITVGPTNLDAVPAIYEQVTALQEYGQRIGSETEVLMTFSEMIWRPHQARGDSPVDSPSSAGLQMKDMPKANEIFRAILDDTYDRLATDRPRILANSSGYTSLIADPRHQEIVVNQDVPYRDGRPEIYDITPRGDIRLDAMFVGPELPAIRSIFGYRDRMHEKDDNPFVQFQLPYREWFPNIVTT